MVTENLHFLDYIRIRFCVHTSERTCTWASCILHVVFQPQENPERAEPTVRFMKQLLFDLSLQHNSLHGLDAAGKKGSLAGYGKFRNGQLPSDNPGILFLINNTFSRRCRDSFILRMHIGRLISKAAVYFIVQVKYQIVRKISFVL